MHLRVSALLIMCNLLLLPAFSQESQIFRFSKDGKYLGHSNYNQSESGSAANFYVQPQAQEQTLTPQTNAPPSAPQYPGQTGRAPDISTSSGSYVASHNQYNATINDDPYGVYDKNGFYNGSYSQPSVNKPNPYELHDTVLKAYSRVAGSLAAIFGGLGTGAAGLDFANSGGTNNYINPYSLNYAPRTFVSPYTYPPNPMMQGFGFGVQSYGGSSF